MKIISHRGFWRKPEEKNSIAALNYSKENNFGTETDLRDYLGNIVVSHDPASSNSAGIRELFEIFAKTGLQLALNIKADGLNRLLKEHLSEYPDLQYFTFDMSIPQMLAYVKDGISVYGRISEIEREIVLEDKVAGIWVDCFFGDWYDVQILESLLRRNKRLCLVSPELHGRDPSQVWNVLHKFRHEDLTLCTDTPDKARDYFGV